MPRNPLQLVAALGLAAAVHVRELADRRQAFTSIHMGTEDLPLGSLLDLLAEETALKPPRTGHIGNWEDIALGRAGAMDFNKAICARGFGYPLIHCFTQTEAEGSPGGDWVYLPGSLAERGRRVPLPLFTWDGTSFTRRGRERGYFCPLVQAEFDGSLVPLVELHWRRMRALAGFDFRLAAAVIQRHATEVRAIVAHLLEQASAAGGSLGVFQDLIGHAAARDGTVARCTLRREGKGYWLEDCHYASTEALVDHVMMMYRAVTEPRLFLADLPALPPLLPVMGNVLNMVLHAHLLTHYPDLDGGRAGVARPFNVHLHWGARDMAGFPPRHKGYFAASSKRRSFRRLCGWLAAHFPDFEPICFVLLPAPVFMLSPTSAHPGDAELLAELFREVRAACPGLGAAPPERLAEAVEGATRSWATRRAGALSPYFMNRFVPRRGVLHAGDLPAASEPVEPDGFRALTLRQATLIAGALLEAGPGPAAG
jgi:hypothetical protein